MITETKPFEHCYWVLPQRLLAGEYPGRLSVSETHARLQRLAALGINTIIDLTQVDELPTYHTVITHPPQPLSIQHQRHSIVDHGVPEPALMHTILQTLTTALQQNRNVYVHCRAGIGRTGTVIGCYLVSQGLQGERALQHLNELWRHCARARNWPSIPETPEQIEYVRQWPTPQH